MYPREGVALVPRALDGLFEDAFVPPRVSSSYDVSGATKLSELGPAVWEELPRAAVFDIADEVVRILRRRMRTLSEWSAQAWTGPITIDERLLAQRTKNALLTADLLENSILQSAPLRVVAALPSFGAMSMLDVLSGLESMGNSEEHPEPLSRSPALRKAAGTLSRRRWAGEIKATDPRFGHLVQAIDPTAQTAAEAAEGVGARGVEASRRTAVLSAIRRLEAEASAAKRLAVPEELDQLAGALTKNRNGKEMVKLRLGFSGQPPMTLSDAGEARSVSRERVRQVEKALLTDLESAGGAWTPRLSRALRRVITLAPTDATTIQNALEQEALIDRPFSLASLLRAAEVFGVEHRLNSGSKGLVFSASDASGLAAEIERTARRLVEHWGTTTVTDLREALDEKDRSTDEETLLLLLTGVAGFRWLERDRAWFWISDVPRSRLLNQVEKIMTVAGSIDIGELRDGVGRHHRMKGFRPPRQVLAALCEASGLYTVEGERVSGGPQLPDWCGVLGKIERTMVDVLFEHGPLMRRSELEERVLARGVKRTSFYVYLSYSPLLRRFAPGVFGLRGATATAAEVESLIPPRVRTQVLQDHGWTKDGEAWVAFRISRASETSGVLGAPGALRSLVRGRFELHAPGGSPVGTLVVEQNIWGLWSFFRRWGVEAGDYVVLAFDLEARRARIEAGEQELLVRYQGGE